MEIHLQDPELTQEVFDKIKELRDLFPEKIDTFKVYNSQRELLMETYMDMDVNDNHELVDCMNTWYNKALLDRSNIKY